MKKYSGQFDVITSGDEKDAIGIISEARISVFVLGCNLVLENMNDLLELVLQRSSRTPCIQLHEPLSKGSFSYRESIFRYIEKPVDPDDVAEAVIEKGVPGQQHVYLNLYDVQATRIKTGTVTSQGSANDAYTAGVAFNSSGKQGDADYATGTSQIEFFVDQGIIYQYA